MSGVLVAIGLGCFLVGAIIDVVLGVAHKAVRALPYVLGLLGSASFFALGVHATDSHSVAVNFVVLSGAGSHALRIDALSGLFLTLLFGLSIAISACFMSWVTPSDREYHRGTALGYLLLLGSVAMILCAANAFLFLFAWELLTVSFYVLTSVTRSSLRQTGAAWSTLGMGKFGGASLLVGFLLLAGRTGSLELASWHAVGSGALLDVAWVLIVVGCGAKLGVVPFQVWVPLGYPAAPGPARAAMAGVAANVGVYGLWRFLEILRGPPAWLVVVTLLCGGVTALLGITFAGVQSGLARVVAYSSIENAGLILTAYGLALTGSAVHSPALIALGLLAATLQTCAHAVAKSALFVSLANIEAVEGSDDLDRLRGVGRRMRWSGVTFGAGALALAGLPPTVGFVSEWFILEALMQQFRVMGLALRLGLAVSAALVALTTGLAALVFLRVLALTFLGKTPRSSERHLEHGIFNMVGLSILILACSLGAAFSPLEVRYIASGLAPIVPRSITLGAAKAPWVLQPVFAGFSVLSPSWLWLILPIAAGAVFLAALLLSRGRFLRIRRVPPWHSASAGVNGRSNYTAFGFANPLRHVLANILGTTTTVSIVPDGGSSEALSYGGQVESNAVVVEPVETYLYRPLRNGVLRVAKAAKRLQSGHLSAYVAYMLVALLAVLAVVAAMR
jgi:formate hydrogenlyase subunit 3/multisubunit Na+/H+ antiporter MnhD subunit